MYHDVVIVIVWLHSVPNDGTSAGVGVVQSLECQSEN